MSWDGRGSIALMDIYFEFEKLKWLKILKLGLLTL